MSKGFYIAKIEVTGQSVAPATLELVAGANVITGLSDTGKSYIVSCINFVFGSQTPLRDIDESKGYDTVSVQICTFDESKIYTLRRGFESPEINLFNVAIDAIDDNSEPELLKLKHSDKGKNVSAFLLNLSGFSSNVSIQKKVVTGDTSAFSFRVLWDFVTASQLRILTDKSPVLNERNTDDTRQKKAFEFLLTGNSAEKQSSVSTKKQVDNARQAGQVEFCDQLINELQGSLTALLVTQKLFGDMGDVDAQIGRLSEQITVGGQQIASRLDVRNQLIDELETLKNKARSIKQMQARFTLLKQHYQSDLSRLDFIDEGRYLIGQLQESMCPTCGQGLTESEHNHKAAPDFDEEAIKLSCQNEAQKIRQHIADLEHTFSTLEADRENLEQMQSEISISVEEVENDLRGSLRTNWSTNKEKLEQLFQFQRIGANIASTHERLKFLTQSRAELAKKSRQDTPAKQPDKNDDAFVDAQEAFKMATARLAESVTKLLHKWHFTKQDASFELDVWDIKVGGKPHASYGAGKRGVVFASFMIGLMNYCRAVKKPHPGFVILDSPLTNHRGELLEIEDEDDEVVPEAVHQAFYEHMSKFKKDRQVIVIDNKSPSSHQQEKIHTIVFTKDPSAGRAGFFPYS